jgi:hypothetical protein
MKIFRVFVLTMVSLKHANMLLLMKKIARISSLFQSNLPNHICKNVYLGLKNLEKVNKNGTRLVQTLTCFQENEIFQ